MSAAPLASAIISMLLFLLMAVMLAALVRALASAVSSVLGGGGAAEVQQGSGYAEAPGAPRLCPEVVTSTCPNAALACSESLPLSAVQVVPRYLYTRPDSVEVDPATCEATVRCGSRTFTVRLQPGGGEALVCCVCYCYASSGQWAFCEPVGVWVRQA